MDWHPIENFIGFGRSDAPVVFIGMEEGLDPSSDLALDLAHRASFLPIMDIQDAHKGIANSARRFDLDKTVGQRTWRPMCDLMLRREGVRKPDRVQRNQYQATRLGRSKGDTILIELLPYPHNKSSDWKYSEFGRFNSRKQYIDQIVPLRKELLRNFLNCYHRDLVVCYGKEHWLHYQDLFSVPEWTTTENFRFADLKSGRIVLTPHFSGRDFNTEVQLENFAKIALNKNV